MKKIDGSSQIPLAILIAALALLAAGCTPYSERVIKVEHSEIMRANIP